MVIRGVPGRFLLRSSTRSFVFLFPLICCLLLTAPASAADHGEPLWFDLLTEDTKAAATFYEELFGWKIGPARGEVFQIFNNGRNIAGLIQIRDEMPNRSEAQWLVGVAVDDLAKAVKSARSAGGTILRDVTKVEGSGTYAVIKDPQGAVLIIGTPIREIGGPREDGNFAWVELWTDDLDGAAKFYQTVIGYERNTAEGPDGAYTVFETAGEPRAGLVPTPNEDARPIWAPYIGVTDLAATLKRTTELGGSVVLAPRADFGGGRVALIEDPTHAMVFVAQLKADKENSR